MNFQTPVNICTYMISLLPDDITIQSVLEPTAGEGNIVKLLEYNGYKVTAPSNFYSLPLNLRFDAVVMNPPFTPMKTGYEILFKCMEMSDIVISLMPWLTIINSQKRTSFIKEWGLKSITHLPRNIFPGSRVQTCILELVKGYKQAIEFKIY